MSDEATQSVTGYWQKSDPLTPAARRELFEGVQPLLLKHVNGWKNLRRWMHHGLLLLTLAAVSFACVLALSPRGSWLDNAVFAVFLVVLFLVPLGAVGYFIGLIARTKMQKTFSDYWRLGDLPDDKA